MFDRASRSLARVDVGYVEARLPGSCRTEQEIRKYLHDRTFDAAGMQERSHDQRSFFMDVPETSAPPEVLDILRRRGPTRISFVRSPTVEADLHGQMYVPYGWKYAGHMYNLVLKAATSIALVPTNTAPLWQCGGMPT